MKNTITAICLMLFSLSISADGEDAMERVIDIPCHCVNDCDFEKKCQWILDDYSLLSPQQSNIDGLQILREQKVFLLEIVDWGSGGCFTTFGLHDGKYVRTDVEVVRFQEAGIKFLLEDVSNVPNIDVRKSAPIEDLCIFKIE